MGLRYIHGISQQFCATAEQGTQQHQRYSCYYSYSSSVCKQEGGAAKTARHCLQPPSSRRVQRRCVNMSTEARIEEIAAENASIKEFIADRDASEINYFVYIPGT